VIAVLTPSPRRVKSRTLAMIPQRQLVENVKCEIVESVLGNGCTQARVKNRQKRTVQHCLRHKYVKERWKISLSYILFSSRFACAWHTVTLTGGSVLIRTSNSETCLLPKHISECTSKLCFKKYIFQITIFVQFK